MTILVSSYQRFHAEKAIYQHRDLKIQPSHQARCLDQLSIHPYVFFTPLLNLPSIELSPVASTLGDIVAVAVKQLIPRQARSQGLCIQREWACKASLTTLRYWDLKRYRF